MKRWFGGAAALVVLAGFASAGLGQPAPPPAPATVPPPPPAAAPPKPSGGPFSLFISPCGRPYRAAADEPYPVVVWFAGADANHDGKLDPAEFRADADIFFRVLDRDHNGMIENEEVGFYEKRIAPEILGTIARNDDPGLLIRVQGRPGNMPDRAGTPDLDRPKPPSANMVGAAAYTFLREPEPVTSSDSNFDHRITAAEFTAAADRRFKMLDKDGDRFLTLDTLPATLVQRLRAEAGKKGRRS
ncbi:MAG: EF-hand domain protein [Caulobacter sp.]|nr:EF-hand domain protein [Caulobacter sp.]